jgi:ketosteroid isomerase-like protein
MRSTRVPSGHGVAAEIVEIADDWARAIAGNDAERIAGVMADEWVIVSRGAVPLHCGTESSCLEWSRLR